MRRRFFVDAVSSQLLQPDRAARGTRAAKANVLVDEISLRRQWTFVP